MRFSFSTLYVRNLDESLSFYEEVLVLRLIRRFSAGPEVEIAFLGEEGSEIELVQDASKEAYDVGTDVSWGFSVEDVQEQYDLLKAQRIPLLSEIIEPQPGVKFFFIEDPNGFRIQLIEEAPRL